MINSMSGGSQPLPFCAHVANIISNVIGPEHLEALHAVKLSDLEEKVWSPQGGDTQASNLRYASEVDSLVVAIQFCARSNPDRDLMAGTYLAKQVAERLSMTSLKQMLAAVGLPEPSKHYLHAWQENPNTWAQILMSFTNEDMVRLIENLPKKTVVQEVREHLRSHPKKAKKEGRAVLVTRLLEIFFKTYIPA